MSANGPLRMPGPRLAPVQVPLITRIADDGMERGLVIDHGSPGDCSDNNVVPRDDTPAQEWFAAMGETGSLSIVGNIDQDSVAGRSGQDKLRRRADGCNRHRREIAFGGAGPR